MYGPGGDDTLKFSEYVLCACKDNIPKLPLTLGEQKRDFIYIDDVVGASTKIVENKHKFSQKNPELELELEIGSSIPTKLRDFVEIANNLTNSRTILSFGEIPYLKLGYAFSCKSRFF